MDEFDPTSLLGDQKLGGIRKQCTDAKRCGLGNICEHGIVRNEACELVSLYDGGPNPTPNTCLNYVPRKELCSEGDLFRSRKRYKHNPLRRSNIVLPKPPDLMVSRHIKDGRDIKDDD